MLLSTIQKYKQIQHLFTTESLSKLRIQDISIPGSETLKSNLRAFIKFNKLLYFVSKTRKKKIYHPSKFLPKSVLKGLPGAIRQRHGKIQMENK